MKPGAESDPWTIGRLLEWSRTWLASKGVDEPRLCTELLLAHAMDCRKIDLYARFDAVPAAKEIDRFRDLIRRAADLEPVAYLVGHKEFYSLRFEVGPEVLIPRPETEALVTRAVEICKSADGRAVHMLDVGTGSGCIAVAVCHYAANARALATDVSPAILAIATRNAEQHGVTDRVQFVEATGLNLPEGSRPSGGFELVVSNPPYVPHSSPDELAENVRKFEPHGALFADENGLAFYRLFARELDDLLASEGAVLLEIPAGRENAVRSEFEAVPGWIHVTTHRDPADPHPRVMEFRRRSG